MNRFHPTLPTLFLIATFALVLHGCELFGGNDDDDPLVTEGVLVANGGNFSDQNGFVTIYDPVASTALNLQDLGGFVHSVSLVDDLAYVAINTFSEGRIDVIDLATSQVVDQMGLPSPRSMAFASDDQLYVTNLSEIRGVLLPGIVSVVDLSGEPTVTEQVAAGFYPEGLAASDGQVYVANSGVLGAGTTLSVIDVATNEVSSTVDLECDGPNEVFVDDQNEVVVVCEGKTVYTEDFTEIVEQTNAQVVFVDPNLLQVTSRVQFDMQVGSGNGTQSAYYAPDAEELYVISSGDSTVVRIDTNTNTLATQFTLPASDDLTGITAVAYDATTEQLYLARLPKGAGGFADYTVAGAVVVLDRAGTQVDRFTVGPAPSHIEFVRR